MSATLAFARALIERASITPADAGCQALIGERLAGAGFQIEHLRFGAVDNLWAWHGDAGPCLGFAGHTDVVPPGPRNAWASDPFEPVERDGMLYGRGAADMKGSLAAMVLAAEAFVRGQPAHHGRIALLITSDEEGEAVDGTARVLEHLAARGERMDWCVVGEPTSAERAGDRLRNGRRGSLTGRLTVKGVQGHVAYPEQVRNPIHELAPVLATLARRRWDAGNAYYPPTSFQVSNVNGGTGADNVVPGSVETVFNFRYCTEQSAGSLMGEVETLLAEHGLDYAIQWHASGEPYLTPEGELTRCVQAAAAEHLGTTPALSTAGGTSDGRFIAKTGAQVVELGPVNATIHKVNECVRIADLDAFERTYEAIARRLLA